MPISTLELTRVRQPVCPRCGHRVDSPLRTSWIEMAQGILAAAALFLMLVPLGIIAWKSWTDFLSNTESHSVLFHPLEDWTHY
jgi:hypothetical protein